MRLLIGTLYSGENEYEECVLAIKRQSYKNYEHIIIRDLPQHEAHKKLYKTFLESSDQYGLLIKVDADTVINSDQLFEKVVEKFSQNHWLDVMNIAVDDFFTARRIPAGIQIYRNTVNWDFTKDTAFPDIPDTPMERFFYDKNELAPAGIHCKNPSAYQAFHYGVHRGIKSIQRIHSTSHWENLQAVWHNFKRSGDVRQGLAVLGAELVYAGKFSKFDADYTNPRMRLLFTKYKNFNTREVRSKINQLKLLNWGVLPNDFRRRWIRHLRSIYFEDDYR